MQSPDQLLSSIAVPSLNFILANDSDRVQWLIILYLYRQEHNNVLILDRQYH